MRLLPALLLLLPSALGAQIAQREYADRRAKLLDAAGDGVYLVLGAGEPAHDYERFEQNIPFTYFVGVEEPDAALVMVRRGAQRAQFLLTGERDPAQETWSGPRLGPAAAGRLTGLPARDVRTLPRLLDSLLSAGGELLVAGEVPGGEGGPVLSPEAQKVALLLRGRPATKARSITEEVDKLRGVKSAAELALIRRAAGITVQAHAEAFRTVAPGRREYEAQAVIEYTFRRNGADRPSFATIVGSGPNSTILHYQAGDREMKAGEVVVMDIGASFDGYAADVTRTVPVSGTFSAPQRAIYQIVRDAQGAAEREARPGASWGRMGQVAALTIATGLAKLGLVDSAEATYDCDEQGRRTCPQWQLYYMHGLGHGIGLEVHDPEQAYLTDRIAAGSAFTIEPGVYVRGNLLEILPNTPRNRAFVERIRKAHATYRDIGVRIEDDYVVGPNGVEWISKAPREIAEVEEAMKAGR